MQLDTDYTHQNVKKENSNNHICKRSKSQIEIDEQEKIETDRKMTMGNYNDFSKSEHQMRKKILKPKPSDNDKIARISRRSNLSNQEYEHWWYDCWFTYEFLKEPSELSSKPEEGIGNLTSLTMIFQIIPSQMDGNWLFHTLNNFVFSGQYSTEDIRNEICAFLNERRIYTRIF